MFSLIFVLLFVQHSPTMAIKCFGGLPNTTSPGDIESCRFQLKLGDAFPDATQLVNDHKCQQYDSTSTVWNASCYASAHINYLLQIVTIKLDAVQTQTSYNSRYEDFGKYNFATKKTQYSVGVFIPRSLLTSRMQILCKTSDDCAIKEIQKSLSEDVAKSKKRIQIFKELNATMNKPKPASNQSSLM